MRKNREIWAADSETDPFKAGRIPKPFIWGAYNGEVYEQFETTAEFVDFISERDCIVYAHNGGKFDWHFLIDKLEPFGELMIIAGRLAKFKIGKAEFRDSYNILPIPLAAYQKDEIDYTLFEEEERYKPENWNAICKYLKADCVYLYDLIKEFHARYGVRLTLAGSALKTWEKIADTKAPKTSAMFYESLAPYYFGGRVQAFRVGEINAPFQVIDINSAYPYAMKHKHPYGEAYSTFDELPDNDDDLSRCFVTLTARSCGAFPYREKNGLSFPNDGEIREFNVSGWEYIAARDGYALKDSEVIKVQVFADTIDFNSYIDHFYTMKSEAKESGDKAGYIFAKLFLNSLYGKFGSNPEKYDEFMVVEPCFIDAAEEDGYAFSAELGDWALVTRDLPEEKQRYYNVAVAASITGFVRAYLYKAMRQCTGLIYCDTDSIAAESFEGIELDPEKLGAWDVEAVCEYGAVAGKKLYAFKDVNGSWKTASKGVRLSAEEIVRVAKGEEIVHTPINPSFSMKRGTGFISRTIRANG